MRIYIKAANSALCDSLAQALEELGAEIICGGADSELPPEGCDAVIVSTPLAEEFGLNYVAQAARQTSACIIVLAKADIAEDVQSRIRFTGAFVLGRPFGRAALVQTVKIALLAKENILRLEEEKHRLSQELSDMRAVDRAKCCLIQYLGMTEEQAHRHIQKLAMDSRCTQREVAEDILCTYDTSGS